MNNTEAESQTDSAFLESAQGQTIPVNDGDSLWIVGSGKVDLFLQAPSAAGTLGARHHILRVEAGDAIFGFHSASRQGLTITAVPLPGARTIRVSRGDWLSPGPWLLERDTCKLQGDWVARLAAAAGEDTPPKKFQALNEGQETEIGEEAQVIAPIEGVLWVEQLEGGSRLFSDPEMSTSEARFFPVSKYGWLEALPGSRVRAVELREVSPAALAWTGLQLFHRHICLRLIQNLKSEENHERERIKRRDAALSASVNEALSDLAAALDPRRIAAVEADSPSSALLLACQRVGDVLGVTFHAPPESSRGVKQKDPVMAIAKASSIRVRQVLLKDKWWTQDLGPMVAFREADNAPVALLPEHSTRYRLFDPIQGQSVGVNGEVAASLTGVAYCFYRPFPRKAIGLSDLLLFGLQPAKRDLLNIVLLGLGGGLLNLLVPIATGILFDSAIPGSQRGQVLVLSLFLFVGAVAAGLLSLTRGYAVLRLQGKMDTAIQAAVWDRLLRLPVPFFRGFTSGDLALRSMTINEIRDALTGSVINSILSGLFSVFSFALLFYYSWSLAILATLLTIATVAIATAAGYLEVHYQRQVSSEQGRVSGIVLQFVNGIAKFRVTGTEGRAFGVWAKAFAQHQHSIGLSRTK